MNDKFIQYLVY